MKLFRLKMPPLTKVIGVGASGINSVNHLYKQGIAGVDFFIFHTDAGALAASPVSSKVQLGKNLTRDVNVGSIPKRRKTASVENIEDIKCVLEAHTKLLFILTGPGGATASAIIAKAAREMDILTIGIVTAPFLFQGHHGMMQTDERLSAFKKQADSFLVISNRGIRWGSAKLSSAAYSALAYNALTSAVKGIAGMVNTDGYNVFGIGDLRKAMKDSGQFIVGNGSAEGMNRAAIAADAAFSIPYFNENRLEDAKSILLHIGMGNRELTIDEYMIIMSELRLELKWDTDIVWNTSQDKTLGEKLSVTIIATRFEARDTRNNPHLFKAERKTIDRDRSGQDDAENRESLFDNKNQETMLKSFIVDLKHNNPDYLRKAKLTFLAGATAKPL